MKFSGIVKKNLGRGKKLGFPTANIEAPKDLVDGLYVGFVEGKPALIFVGANETFEEADRQAEVYLLDFMGDLYDKKIHVETIKKTREVIKFNSAEELIEQMKQDEQVAREFFANYNIGK